MPTLLPQTKRLAPLLITTALALTTAFAAPQTPAEKEVLAAEQTRTTALDHSDIPTLDKIMADDVTYVHASGKVDTKQTYLEAIRSGQLHYISWTPKDLHVRVSGDTGVITGEYAVRVSDTRVQPTPFDISIYILTVYAKRNGHWQQIAWQSTRDVVASPLK
jgi:ketosteroid isomerase-like protein